MAMDRFLIAPFDKESGLQTKLFKYEAYDIGLNYFEGCKVKRIYKKREDVIDELNKVYFDLTVIAYAGHGKYRGANWLCRCVCGKECVVPGGHLRKNMRKSCGCRSEAFIESTGINRLFSSYKTGAKKRDVIFELSRDEFKKLVKGNCSYCGSEPNQLLKRQKTRKIQIIYNGIDRVSNDKGYTIENSVTACMYCNRSKSNLSLETWKNHVKRIYQWLQIGS